MSWFRWLTGASSHQSCRGCAHFDCQEVSAEAALAGLAVLSSGHASVRSADGLCLRHDMLTNGRKRCPDFFGG